MVKARDSLRRGPGPTAKRDFRLVILPLGKDCWGLS